MSSTATPPAQIPTRGAWRRRLALPALVGTCAWLTTAGVMVDETEFVVVERLGTIVSVYDTPASRGLHFKLPWPIETVRRFDRRIHFFDPPGREVFTRDKKNITVSAYINWRIAEPTSEVAAFADSPVVRFYRGLGSREIAEARLETRLRSILTTLVGQIELDSLLEVESSEAGPRSPEGGLLDRLSTQLTAEVRRRADEDESTLDRLGIELVDVRIRRINFPEGNQQSVFERMKSERRKIAERYRSAGQADSQMIRSRADRQYTELLARARGDAERIRGRAEAEAVGILNDAHALDPEFYQTLRTLDAYRKFLNEKTTLILSSSSPLLKLLTEGLPPETSESPPALVPLTVGEPDAAKTSIVPAPRRTGTEEPEETPR